MPRPQRATGSVSVQRRDVFFVSVQSTWSLNTSGSSQARTLPDKLTLKLYFPTCTVVTLLHLSLIN